MRISLHRIFLTACMLLSAGSFYVSAQDTRAQESRKARLEAEIKILDSQLKDNAAKSSGALNNLGLVRKKIAARKELLTASERTIAALESQISSKQQEINKIQNRLDTLSLYYSRLVKGAYKNRDTRIWYMYILASANFGQAMRRFGYLRNLSSEMNSQGEKIKAVRAQLEEETANLEKMKRDAERIRGERLAQVNELKRAEAESKSLVNTLQRDKNKYQKQLNDKRRQVEALNREIARIIAEATTEKPSSGKKGGSASKPSQPIDYKLAGEFEANKGKLPWPAEGPVVDHYGQSMHPVYKGVKLPFNNGVTIALNKGQTVKAVFDGVVKQIVAMPGYNQCVLVQHGNYFTFYCKLGSVSVKPGDKIKTGQAIGVVDTVGGETQLHFQLWAGRKPQNPETWLRP